MRRRSGTGRALALIAAIGGGYVIGAYTTTLDRAAGERLFCERAAGLAEAAEFATTPTLSGSTPSTSRAADAAKPLRRYECRSPSVVDGDTIRCGEVLLGLRAALVNQTVRIAHINTPELRSTDAAERSRAADARDFVTAALAKAPVYLDVNPAEETENYGRILAVVVAGGKDVGASELAAGLAKSYEGRGPKP